MGDQDAWGIQQEWVDAHDVPHRSPDTTVRRLREVIGTPPPDLEDTAPVVTRPGAGLELGPATVTCEDGTVLPVTDVLPDDVPLGYHRLRTADGRDRRLIVSPGTCWLPERQMWGWTVQLYAACSAASWGMGDLADLRLLREWTERQGGGFILVNPLHAVGPGSPQEASPYLPATRRFRNPLYLRPCEVPGYASSPDHESRRRQLAGTPLIERDAVWSLKHEVLRSAFDAGGRDAPGFDSWRTEQGRPLEQFAVWSAIALEHGPDWRAWPATWHDPDGAEVATYAASHRDEVTFQAWLQWALDEQLRAATGAMTVLQDLPIGVSGGGADAWVWQGVLAAGVQVGAPPDRLNTTGQDWGSPPLVPWRLRAADYQPFIDSVRATISGAGGLRIDHVLGLFRLWWIPEGCSARDGAYVRYPSDDLLDIVALESHRAGAVVVGEDLGTVEPGVGKALAERNLLSYKLLWFEDGTPADWPVGALAAVTTHDLPTVAGLWTGSDARDLAASTDMSEDDISTGREELLDRLRRGGLPLAADSRSAVEAAYRQLADAPSLLLSVALEDAVVEERRPNVPGTVERENWRIPLPVLLDDLVASAVPDPVGVVATTVRARAEDRPPDAVEDSTP